MKIVIQRCKKASVKVNNKIIGKIDYGMALLVGFTHNDGIDEIEYMIDKLINIRIFDDESGVMNKSIKDINGSILSVSQFTLYANTQNGRRPSYIEALDRKEAIKLYNLFNEKLKEQNIKVETGEFGAEMELNIINDGPVTIILERGGKNGK